MESYFDESSHLMSAEEFKNKFSGAGKQLSGLRSRLDNINTDAVKEKLGNVGGTIKNLAWDQEQRWYLKSTFLTIAGRMVRFAAIVALWTTCFLAFAYYPYHLQIRRIGSVVKSSLSPGELIAAGTGSCPDASLSSLDKPFGRLTIGDNLGFKPFDTRDESDYKTAKANLDEDPLSVFNVWEDLQLFSRVLAIGEWFLLGMIIIYSLAFINYAVVGTLVLITGRNIDQGNFASKYEFWSQTLFFAVGVLSAVVVFTHDITAFQMQSRQLKVVESYEYVCQPGFYPCFQTNNDATGVPLCDFLRGNNDDTKKFYTDPTRPSNDPWEYSTDLCFPTNKFIIEDCNIFGQGEVSAGDVLSFGQYRFGGFSCSDYYCPPSDSRDTMVQMASKAMWQSLGEGPELSLGVSEYSYNSTQGMIVSMHVFGWIFVILTLIDFAMLMYSVIVISVDKDWKSVTGDIQKAVEGVKGLTRDLKVFDRSKKSEV